jgi:hypothetical protein
VLLIVFDDELIQQKWSNILQVISNIFFALFRIDNIIVIYLHLSFTIQTLIIGIYERTKKHKNYLTSLLYICCFLYLCYSVGLFCYRLCVDFICLFDFFFFFFQCVDSINLRSKLFSLLDSDDEQLINGIFYIFKIEQWIQKYETHIKQTELKNTIEINESQSLSYSRSRSKTKRMKLYSNLNGTDSCSSFFSILLFHFQSNFCCHLMMCTFLSFIDFDHTALLDFIVSNETNFLEYFMW